MVKDLYQVAFSHLLKCLFHLYLVILRLHGQFQCCFSKGQDIVARRYAIHKFDLLEVYKDKDGLPGKIEPKSPSCGLSPSLPFNIDL